MSPQETQGTTGPEPEQPGDSDLDLPTIYGHDYPLPLRPIVFVPGIMGSKIDVKGQGEHLWPPIYVSGDGTFHFGSTNRLVNLPAGVKEATGPIDLAYDTLLKYLQRLRGARNFFPFWYDWTQSNQTSGAQLADFITAILDRPDYKGKITAVDIVNHSMGGLVTRSAYLLSGAGGHIRRVAYIASPHFGAPKAFFVANADFPWLDGVIQELVGFAVWQTLKQSDDRNTIAGQIKFLAQRIQSFYELLPDRFYWPARTMVFDNHGFGTRYPITSMEATYYDPDWGFPRTLRPRVEAAMQFKTALGRDIPPGGKGTRLMIYSGDQLTLDQIDYDDFIGDYDYDTPYASVPQNGDGTVPVYSATAGLEGKEGVVSVPGTHSGVPEHAETHLLVGRFLQRSPS